MKIKLLTAICAFTLLSSVMPSSAYEDRSLDVLTDVTLVRPGCFIVTMFGSILFVAILPVTAISGSVKSTGHTLVTIPAKATFTRPVGDFTSIEED